MFWPSAALVIVAVIVAVTITLHRSMKIQHELNLRKLEAQFVDSDRLTKSADHLASMEAEKTKAAYQYGIEQARFGMKVLYLVELGKWPEKDLHQIAPAIVRQLDGEFPPRPPRQMARYYDGADLIVGNEMRSM